MIVPPATTPLILLLEDEPLNALDIETLFMDAGLSVHTIGSCKEGLGWLEINRPAFAILDIGLSNGPCNRVVDALAEENVPFIVHTGDLRSLHEETSFIEVISLTKPCRPDELVAQVQTQLQCDTIQP